LHLSGTKTLFGGFARIAFGFACLFGLARGAWAAWLAISICLGGICLGSVGLGSVGLWSLGLGGNGLCRLGRFGCGLRLGLRRGLWLCVLLDDSNGLRARLGGGRLCAAGATLAPIVIAVAITISTVIAVIPARPIFPPGRRVDRGFGGFDQSVFAISKIDHCGQIGLIAAACVLSAIFAPRALIAVTLITVGRAIATLTGIPVLATILAAILGKLLLTGLLLGGHFALSLTQKAGVVFSVLQEILGRHPVIRQLGITSELLIFLDHLLRRATNLAFGARAFEDTVDDIAEGARAVLLGARTGLGRAHLVL